MEPEATDPFAAFQQATPSKQQFTRTCHGYRDHERGGVLAGDRRVVRLPLQSFGGSKQKCLVRAGRRQTGSGATTDWWDSDCRDRRTWSVSASRVFPGRVRVPEARPRGADPAPRAAGVTFLDRTSRRVELTPAGRVLLTEGRRMLDGSQGAIRLVRAARVRAFDGRLLRLRRPRLASRHPPGVRRSPSSGRGLRAGPAARED